MNGPTKKQKLLRLLLSLALLTAAVLAVWLPLRRFAAPDGVFDLEHLRLLIERRGGAYSYVVFFLLQFLQVTLLPIPAAVVTMAGSLVFGPWPTFFVSFAAIMAGSAFAFWVGRRLGRRVVGWIIGEETAQKWRRTLSQGKFVFFLMMLFPLFPDDVLCMVAGMTDLSWRFFLCTNLITRPIALFLICFLGSGTLIPFSGWGLAVWAVLLALAGLAFYLSLRYGNRLEQAVLALARRRKERRK